MFNNTLLYKALSYIYEWKGRRLGRLAPTHNSEFVSISTFMERNGRIIVIDWLFVRKTNFGLIEKSGLGKS